MEALLKDRPESEEGTDFDGSGPAVILPEPVLQLEQLSISAQGGLRRRLLVHSLNLAVRPGETLALVGESGSGKSLTASAILGLLPASAQVEGGRILFEGREISRWPDRNRRKLLGSQIACVFQDYRGSFTPSIRLGKQMVETIRSHEKLTVRGAKELALEWLDLVNLPAERVYRSYPFQLSGGQLQRAALACAMMLKPKLLVADEPTTALDTVTGELVLDLLAGLQRQVGCAVLMISHDLRQVLKRADTVAVMRDGRIVETGTAPEIRFQARHEYTQMLLRARMRLFEPDGESTQCSTLVEPDWGSVQSSTPFEPDGKSAPNSTLVESLKAFGETSMHPDTHGNFATTSTPFAPPCRSLESAGTALPKAAAEGKSLGNHLLEVVHIAKTYRTKGGSVPAVQDITLGIGEGECVGLVGESGSGKSTLSRLLLGLERPDRGEIRFMGRSLTELQGREMREARRHIQVVFQDPTASLNQRLPIWRSVIEPLDNFPDAVPPFLAEVRHSRRETAVRLLKTVGLPAGFTDRYPHELSGGQRQRVAIARAIALNPKLLICDEPTSSLDVNVQSQLLALLKNMRKRLGMACLFISHDLASVRYMSDRIVVMKDGRIVDHFESGRLTDNERDDYTRQLLEAASE